MTLATRLLLLIVLALLPPLALQAWSGLEQRQEHEAALQMEALAQSRAVQAEMASMADGVRRLLVAIAEQPAIRSGDAAGCTAYLREVAVRIRDYVLLAANDADGRIRCNNLGVPPGEYSSGERAYHKRAMATGSFAVGDLVTGIATGRRSIHFALPFRGMDGSPGGIVLASVDQDKLVRQLSAEALPAGAIAMLIDPSGQVVAAVRDGKAADAWVGGPVPAGLRAALAGPAPATVQLPGPDGLPRLFGITAAEPILGGATVAVALDGSRALAELSRASWRMVFGLVLGAMLALLAGMLVARRFVLAPIARLVDAADRVGRGQLGGAAALGGRGAELREVGDAFDRMSTALATRQTERDRAEMARHSGEARLARILATTPAGVIELDPSGGMAYANQAAERLLGAPPGGLVGRRFDDPVWDLAALDGVPIAPVDRPVAFALRGEAVRMHEHALTTLDGRRIVLVVDTVPIHGAAGRVEGALATFQDVTARNAAIASLRASEERYRTLFEAIDAGFCILEMAFDAAGRAADYRLLEVNPAFAAQTGLNDAEGRWMRDLVPKHEQRWYDLFGGVARTGQAVRLEERAEAMGRYYDVHAFRVGEPAAQRVAVLFNDVTARRAAEDALRLANESLETRVAERTGELNHVVDALHVEAREREEAEAQLRQSQKMEAVGQLTGGIAHDFNNMLQAISGSLELMQRRIEQGRGAEAARHVAATRATVTRAAALTHRLLAFARRQALDPRPVDPDALIEDVADLVRRAIGPGVACTLQLGAGQAVLCDPNQLENVLLNLAINARDAMPEGGTLTIATRAITLSEAELVGQEASLPGAYVEIAVSDTGAGMDEATRARAFEPFFTTKPIGAGSGLGLSQVYGFVHQSGGFVRLDSAPGRGTTVRLCLPRNDGAAGAGVEAVDAVAPGRSAGTVLLVEDEAEIRRAAAEHLRELGLVVLDVADGEAALAILQGGTAVDVLVTDVGLPGLNGRQVADAAREGRPGLPVIFVTGYAGDALTDILPAGMSILAKPFGLDALAARVQGVIGQDGGGV